MVFFIAAGTISNAVVRRETRDGVLTTFRLETGAPRKWKLWIDVEAWGHLAGTIAQHGIKGRGVSVSGRLTQKTWRDKDTGEARSRYVVTARDVDFHQDGPLSASATPPPNAVLARGVVEAIHSGRDVKTGAISSFRLRTGKASSKSGVLYVTCEIWTPDQVPPPTIQRGEFVTAIGALVHQSDPAPERGDHIRISARTLATP